MEGTAWAKILSHLTIAHKTNLAQINKKDLVSFCLENEVLRNSVDDYLKNVKTTEKDSAAALQKKEEGNKYLLEKKYKESVQLYTECIFYAKKNDAVLPLAYANRGFALQQLGHLTESNADIDMALATGYPKDKANKLMLRRAKCLELTNEEGKNEMKKRCRIPEYQLPKLAGGENKDFASASNYLGVYFDENKGRHVIAKEDIQLGEVLFVEKAFAHLAHEEAKACDHCLKKTIAPIPCENCLDVFYCSLKCREGSWKSAHSFHCGFGELFKSVGIAHLSVKVLMEASKNLVELKNKLNNISEPQYKNGPVLFRSKKYDSVYNLVHHLDKCEIGELFQYTMTALLMAVYFKKYTHYFTAEAGNEDLQLLTSIILQHIMQMICNAHVIFEAFVRGTKDSMVSSKEKNIIGVAIFPSASMMNHSCEPSVIMGFYKTYMIVQSNREIKKGEEVFNCYVANAKRMERTTRQEILLKQYFFKCECQICLQKFNIQNTFRAVKCFACKGLCVQNDKTKPEVVCIHCGKESKLELKLLSKLWEFYSKLEEGKFFISQPDLALQSLSKAWKLGKEIFYKFHEDLGLAADLIAVCLAKQQKFRKCISFLKYSALSNEERFGALSIEVIEVYNKLYDVSLAYLSSLEGCLPRDFLEEFAEVFQKSQRIIQILDGNPYFHLKKITSFKEFSKLISQNPFKTGRNE